MNVKLTNLIRWSAFDETVTATAAKVRDARPMLLREAQREVKIVNDARAVNNIARRRAGKRAVDPKPAAHIPFVHVPRTDREVRRALAQLYPTARDRGRLRAKLVRIIANKQAARAQVASLEG